MTHRSKWRQVLGLAAGLIALFAIGGSALAQPLPEFRFYGFSGSVTIDGEPAPAGTVIVASADGEELARGTVSENGAWWVDVKYAAEGVSFSVNGIEAEGVYDADRPSGSQQVILAVETGAPAMGEDDEDMLDSEDSLLEDDEDMLDSEDSLLEDDEDMLDSEEDLLGTAEEEDGMKDAVDSMSGGDAEAEDTTMQSDDDDESLPVGGTGGLADESGSTWPLAAGLTALLVAGLGGAALLVSRRTGRAIRS